MADFQLYHYWRSSSSWRVRASLNYKKISCDYQTVDLAQKENLDPSFKKLSPYQVLPVFVAPKENLRLTESLAILNWLEARFAPTLLPSQPNEQALVWERVSHIACNIFPVQNVRVQRYFFRDKADGERFAREWIRAGFVSLEMMLKESAGSYAVGSQLSLADLVLVPQVYNAVRFGLDLSPFPLIERIYAHHLSLSVFQETHPDRFQGK